MSFKHNGVVITLANYLEVFGDLEPDILDEIRSAILDDTPISGFIKYCEDDSYKLGQLRLAVREYLPKEFINPRLSGRCIYLLRQLYRNGYNLSILEKYIPKRGAPTIENENLEVVLRAALHGADIKKVDFNIVPTENINIICEGLVKRYPMWLCVSPDRTLSNSIIRQLMKGMQLQIDIHPFLNGDWSENQIVTILSNATKINVNELLENINSKFSMEQIMEVIYVARNKLDYALLCLKESDGTPAFNQYQMSVIGKCLEDDILTEEIYDPQLSDMEMEDLRIAELDKRKAEGNRKLGGTLRKR